MTTSLSTAAATSPPTRGPSPCHTTSNSPACPTSRQEDSPRLPARPVGHHYWRRSRGSSLLETVQRIIIIGDSPEDHHYWKTDPCSAPLATAAATTAAVAAATTAAVAAATAAATTAAVAAATTAATTTIAATITTATAATTTTAAAATTAAQ